MFSSKKQCLPLFSALLAAVLISGCAVSSTQGAKSNNIKSAASVSTLSNENVYEIKTKVDWVKASKTLKELYQNSSLIAEITVHDTEYSADENGRISTRFTPEIINAFKGSYSGGKITSFGGIMDYKEYSKIKDAEVKNLNPAPEKVLYNFGGIPIVKPGDTFIVFLSEKNGVYTPVNAFEGLYKIDGDNLVNEAIKDSPLFKEIAGSNSSKINKANFISRIKGF